MATKRLKCKSEKLEHAEAGRRAKVAYPFGVIKKLAQASQENYRGFAKNTSQRCTLLGYDSLIHAVRRFKMKKTRSAGWPPKVEKKPPAQKPPLLNSAEANISQYGVKSVKNRLGDPNQRLVSASRLVKKKINNFMVKYFFLPYIIRISAGQPASLSMMFRKLRILSYRRSFFE